MNKDSGGDGILAELLQILKDGSVLLKCCIQYASKSGKLSSTHRTGKGQFSSQSQRRAMPNKVQTTIQLCLFHMLARLCSNPSSQASAEREPKTSRCQAGFRKGRGTRDQIANIYWITEKARNSRRISTSTSLTTPKPLTVWITENCGKFLKRQKYQTTLPIF